MCTNMGGRGSSSGRGGKNGKISSSGLPQLNGTEKQVAWANDIRQSYINSFNDFLGTLQNPTNNDLIGARIQSLQYIEPFLNSIIGAENTANVVSKSRLTKEERKNAIAKAPKGNQSLTVTKRNGEVGTVNMSGEKIAVIKAKATKMGKMLAGVSPQFKKGIAEKTEAKWWIEHRPY